MVAFFCECEIDVGEIIEVYETGNQP
jgi:hypothetical protein